MLSQLAPHKGGTIRTNAIITTIHFGTFALSYQHSQSDGGSRHGGPRSIWCFSFHESLNKYIAKRVSTFLGPSLLFRLIGVPPDPPIFKPHGIQHPMHVGTWYAVGTCGRGPYDTWQFILYQLLIRPGRSPYSITFIDTRVIKSDDLSGAAVPLFISSPLSIHHARRQ